MKNEKILITAVGTVVTLCIGVGTIFLTKSITNDSRNVYANDIAVRAASYTDKYNNAVYAYNEKVVNALKADEISIDAVKNDESITGIKITQNGELVSDVDVSSDNPAHVYLSVDDNGNLDVSVVSQSDLDAEEEAEKPVIVDGEEIYLSDITVVSEDGTLIYHIERGDTLCRISSIFGYSVQELAEYNHIPNPNLIYANSSLRIPSGEWKSEE